MTQNPVSGPGYADQARKRTLFRVVGIVSMGIAVVLIGIAITDFFQSFDSDPMSGSEPTKFWMFFAAMPFFLVGAACLNAGFMGAAARYGAGETAPVLKDSASYLSDGQGVLGVGRTVDDRPAGGTTPGAFCSQCGAGHDRDARFCKSCGASLA